jgi:hypothetical protein
MPAATSSARIVPAPASAFAVRVTLTTAKNKPVARLDVGISGRDARLAILNVAVPGISRFRVRCFPIAPE